jgi:hypothetical protein
LAFNGLACSLLLKDFMPVKLPSEPGDITAYQLLVPFRQNIEGIVITVLFLNYSPGMLVALSESTILFKVPWNDKENTLITPFNQSEGWCIMHYPLDSPKSEF